MTMPALGRRGAETIRPAPLRPIVSLTGVAHRPWRLRGHGPCSMSDSEGRVGRAVGPDANGVRSRCKGTFTFRRAPYGRPGAAPRPRRPPPPSSPRSVDLRLETGSRGLADARRRASSRPPGRFKTRPPGGRHRPEGPQRQAAPRTDLDAECGDQPISSGPCPSQEHGSPAPAQWGSGSPGSPAPARRGARP